MTTDYYADLGISKDASADQIKKAYRSLAFKYHPGNKETGSEARFKAVSQAYDVLSDPERRTHYDRFGSDSHNAGASAYVDSIIELINAIRSGEIAHEMLVNMATSSALFDQVKLAAGQKLMEEYEKHGAFKKAFSLANNFNVHPKVAKKARTFVGSAVLAGQIKNRELLDAISKDSLFMNTMPENIKKSAREQVIAIDIESWKKERNVDKLLHFASTENWELMLEGLPNLQDLRVRAGKAAVDLLLSASPEKAWNTIMEKMLLLPKEVVEYAITKIPVRKSIISFSDFGSKNISADPFRKLNLVSLLDDSRFADKSIRSKRGDRINPLITNNPFMNLNKIKIR